MSYQSAEKLRTELRNIGIDETWIIAGGVSIQCFRHEVKKTMRVINKMSEELNRVSLHLTLKDKKNGFIHGDLIRKQGVEIRLM